eukprot:365240-Chlamydomonas_euryale.AAC.4
MEPMRGIDPWNRPMESTHGTDPWNRPMEPTRGTDPWNRPMESTHGTDPWNRCVEPTHGTDRWPHRTPTATRSSAAGTATRHLPTQSPHLHATHPASAPQHVQAPDVHAPDVTPDVHT